MEGKDKPIKDMEVWGDAIQSSIDMLECISMEEIQHASSQNDHLQQLKKFIVAGWPDTKDELHTNIRLYWPDRDELAVIDAVIHKGRHMGIEKTKLLTHDSVFWSNINANIEAYIKHCATCLEFQQMQPKEKITHHDIPLRPWEVVGADVFHLKNKHYFCIVHYNSKFPVVKRLEGLSADNLISTVKIIFAEYGVP